ncbi:DUF2399 domain-containing protein [Kitasatospora sp. NPDC096077]|uniref:DUF2399 domain-containing protein n=1 Tax=Kitasatospora sp. NPDC096077 TaxID=3155544 RepID=UPI0033223129
MGLVPRVQRPPPVCTSGWPDTAVIHLLRRLADDGARSENDGRGERGRAYDPGVDGRAGDPRWRRTCGAAR